MIDVQGDAQSGAKARSWLSESNRPCATSWRVWPRPSGVPRKFGSARIVGLAGPAFVRADPIYKPLEATRNWVKAGWKTFEIRCGHDAMLIAPDRRVSLQHPVTHARDKR